MLLIPLRFLLVAIHYSIKPGRAIFLLFLTRHTLTISREFLDFLLEIDSQ